MPATLFTAHLGVLMLAVAACGDNADATDPAEPYPAEDHVLIVKRDAVIAFARAELLAKVPQADTSGEPSWLFFDQYSEGVAWNMDRSALFVTWPLPEADHITYDVPGAGSLRSTAVGARLVLSAEGEEALPTVMRMVDFTFFDENIPPQTSYSPLGSGLVTFMEGQAAIDMTAALEAAAAEFPGLTYALLEQIGIASLTVSQTQLPAALAYLRGQAGVIAAELDSEQYSGAFFGSDVQVVDASAAAIDLRPYMAFTGGERDRVVFDTAPSLAPPFGPGVIRGVGEGLGDPANPSPGAALGYVATVDPAYDAARCLATAQAQFATLDISAAAAGSLRINGASQREVYESIATILAYPCIASARPAGIAD